MEGCESCTLSHSMDGHRSHVSIFLLKKVITKRRIILDMQFPNQPLGVKWKVVKVVHCPTRWIGHRSHVSNLTAEKSYYKKKDNFGHAIP